METLLQHTTR